MTSHSRGPDSLARPKLHSVSEICASAPLKRQSSGGTESRTNASRATQFFRFGCPCTVQWVASGAVQGFASAGAHQLQTRRPEQPGRCGSTVHGAPKLRYQHGSAQGLMAGCRAVQGGGGSRSAMLYMCWQLHCGVSVAAGPRSTSQPHRPAQGNSGGHPTGVSAAAGTARRGV